MYKLGIQSNTFLNSSLFSYIQILPNLQSQLKRTFRKAFGIPHLGESRSPLSSYNPFSPSSPWFFSLVLYFSAQLSPIVPHWELLESWDWVAFIFVSPKGLIRASHVGGKKGWVIAARGPVPGLSPLSEEGRIKAHSLEGAARLVHLGDLWGPQVQGSS